ncbi:uncharacterized protein LOC109727284 [Ananas comosus]|uniref:Nonsense-mediated mRNA decay factor SMG8 n=1 Tax=Ananas comosus TaxID=4615 RepID=A0A6P5H555_ANACO|nr:uncharacterized protein LOC109727284 [Ananas comosus]XP_020112931.1 uncharacterized protein LOC109727284 [Ananas comosus]
MEPRAASPSVRVLMRPPPPPSSSSTPQNPNPPTPSSSLPPLPPPHTSSSSSSSSTTTSAASTAAAAAAPSFDGVVVVGFVGSRASTDAAHLINRIVDANVFGSGGLDEEIVVAARSEPRPEEEEDWSRFRRVSYYHDAEKGMVFLQLSSSLSLTPEEFEADDLRGMLFMFSVCHVIIFVHEGLRFETQFLKKFRILQAAKHALAPFVRSQVSPPSLVRKSPSSSSLPTTSRASSISPPTRHGRTSAISLMSGNSSHVSVLPGQCTPVILFVFTDFMLDGSNSLNTSPSSEDSVDSSSLSQPSSLSGLPKQSLTLKGSGSVVMLARPVSKTEGSFRKKLHSSLEAQIRFLIKKCRTLVGSEPGHFGSRGSSNLAHLPLFSVDSSRVVALLDRAMIRKGDALDFVTGLIEDSLSSKSELDLFSLNNHCNSLNNEDVQSIKDFILRQSDMLRGRGALPSNASSGSVAGVGMVAAAAAAAAASAAAGKALTAPELPSLNNWLSLSTSILTSLLSTKIGLSSDSGSNKSSALQSSVYGTLKQQISPQGTKSIEAALSCLENSTGLNMKFSISWCQKALPAVKDVYLKDLPAFYPTATHEAQLRKALSSFHSMVKGPAMQMFSKKLEDECRSIWESGRQQCDAVSLTGKLCMYQRHDKEKQHSSGYVFLHACACGRSRRLRDDPFDFESANISFNSFPNCEDNLPTLILPRASRVEESLPVDSWHLVRLGGTRYYKPSKGLLQTGFCSSEKHLLRWIISIEKSKGTNSMPNSASPKSTLTSVYMDSKTASSASGDVKKLGIVQVSRESKQVILENPIKRPEMTSIGQSGISFGKGLPAFTMKKPFSEVVAGKAIKDSEFPSLQQRREPKPSGEKGIRQVIGDQTDDRIHSAYSNQAPRTENASVESANRTTCNNDEKPFLQIGSNIVPVIVGAERTKPSKILQQFVVYIGFEHECPYGHRFLLSEEHLKEFETPYSSSEDFEINTESKNGVYEVPPNVSGVANVAQPYVMKSNKLQSFRPVDDKEKLEESLAQVKFNDGGSAFSLLNRKLPIYMNCPHCRSSAKQENKNAKFASTISQLQRIFLVTPEFPVVLATCPVVQFEDSCLPPSISDHNKPQSRFSIGCHVILPPESFLTLRLPFVYGVHMEDGSLHPLNHLEHRPELSAWLVEGTALQVVSVGHAQDDEVAVQ